MKLSLIIDGNYVLYKSVFNLKKYNSIYGGLYNMLDQEINKFSKLFSFDKIYLVSDKKISWRKKLYKDYKSKRKKDRNIDWEYVFEEYDNFKSDINIKVLERDNIEGDDLIYFISKENEKKGVSNLIISNDFDLKQIVYGYANPLFFNLMINDNSRSPHMFVPKNYKVIMSSMATKKINIFDDNDSTHSIYRFLKELHNKYTPKITDNKKDLIIKILSGDTSDNIKGVYPRIGEKTAEKIYNSFLTTKEKIKNYDSYDLLSDMVIEQTKATHEDFKLIRENIIFNNSLINLKHIPKNIVEKIKSLEL